MYVKNGKDIDPEELKMPHLKYPNGTKYVETSEDLLLLYGLL
jgi:hypothetical protein